jgi:hypothetical protein
MLLFSPGLNVGTKFKAKCGKYFFEGKGTQVSLINPNTKNLPWPQIQGQWADPSQRGAE